MYVADEEVGESSFLADLVMGTADVSDGESSQFFRFHEVRLNFPKSSKWP